MRRLALAAGVSVVILGGAFLFRKRILVLLYGDAEAEYQAQLSKYSTAQSKKLSKDGEVGGHDTCCCH
jgi:hypothetical protein